MDRILTGTIFGGYARVAIITIKDAVNEEIKIHNLSPLSAAALGRTMTAGAYIGANLKNKDDSYSLSIKGDGVIGGVIVAGKGDNTLHGYVVNPAADLPLKQNGHLDVGMGIGKGKMTVLKDLGLKEPYSGQIELVSGEIAEDFACYLNKSEGINSAVALGVLVDKTGCIGAGGIICEALPGIDENMLFMLEDIAGQFTNVSKLLSEKIPEEIFDFYFGHLDAEVFPSKELKVKCSCSERKIKNVLLGLGKKECDDILSEQGKIEINCRFCEKKYLYTKEKIEALWQK